MQVLFMIMVVTLVNQTKRVIIQWQLLRKWKNLKRLIQDHLLRVLVLFWVNLRNKIKIVLIILIWVVMVVYLIWRDRVRI
jgi:hypothetical protein